MTGPTPRPPRWAVAVGGVIVGSAALAVVVLVAGLLWRLIRLVWGI